MSNSIAVLVTKKVPGCMGTPIEMPCIDVVHKGGLANRSIDTTKGDTLYFANYLEGRGSIAKVYFYEKTHKGDSTKLISNFCGPRTPNPIEVKPQTTVPCAMENSTANDREVEYTVEAVGHKELDPVIIIKPALVVTPCVSCSLFPVSTLVAGALLLAALAGWWLNSRNNT